jgi:hypothetical protein
VLSVSLPMPSDAIVLRIAVVVRMLVYAFSM